MNYKLINLCLLFLPFLNGSQRYPGYIQASVTNQCSMDLHTTSNDVPVSKEKQRQELYQLLGKLPDRSRPGSLGSSLKKATPGAWTFNVHYWCCRV